MSYRDQECRTASDTNLQEVATAFQGLLHGADFSVAIFRDDCRWKPLGLAMMALLWGWSGKTGVVERFEQALRVMQGLGKKRAPVQTSYQAFMKMLVRWTKELRAALLVTFQHLMESECPDHFRTYGFLVLAADGSKVLLPRSRSNERRYAPKKKAHTGTRGARGHALAGVPRRAPPRRGGLARRRPIRRRWPSRCCCT